MAGAAAVVASSDTGEEDDSDGQRQGRREQKHGHRGPHHALLDKGTGPQPAVHRPAATMRPSSGRTTLRYAAWALVCAVVCVAALCAVSALHLWGSAKRVGGLLVDVALVPPSRAPAAPIALPSSFASHYRLHSTPSQPTLFSSHRCVGPDLQYGRRLDDYISRRCLLYNVCVRREPLLIHNGSELAFVVDYFRPEQDVAWADPFSAFDSTDSAATLQPLVALRHGGRAEHNEKLHSLVVSVQPAAATRGVRFQSGTHVLHQLLASGDMNFGHFLLDDAFAVWETVRSFDPAVRGSRTTQTAGGGGDERYAADSVQVLLVTGCSEFSAPLDELCGKFASALFPAVSSRAVLGVQSAYSRSHTSEAEPLCFERLIAGTGSAGAVGWSPNNRNRAASFSAFRSDLYAAHGLDPHHRPQRHHLVLVNKRGRRGFNNLMATYEQLRLTARYAEVQMTVVDDFKRWSFVEQLQLLSNATIVLSPCGGISMLFLLLPHPATLIVSTYPERLADGSVRAVRMEGQVWDWQSNVHTEHYAVLDDSDFELSDGVNPLSRYSLRNHASTVLKLERLLPLLDQAIIRAAAPQ